MLYYYFVSLQIGKKLVLDSPQEEFVIQMLLSLSKLTLKSILLIPDQVTAPFIFAIFFFEMLT